MGERCVYSGDTVGTGTAVVELACDSSGTSLFKKVTAMRVTTSVVIGAVIYKACVATAIKCGIDSTYMKLISAVLFLVILVLSMDRKKKAKIAEERKAE